ncbi:hypothetical protein, partial [Sporomusa sp.]|uniref:hypothetical protein n=1 Tax=Sporomusa sp. TaxID=2078658 RepID=UPI002B6D6BE3
KYIKLTQLRRLRHVWSGKRVRCVWIISCRIETIRMAFAWFVDVNGEGCTLIRYGHEIGRIDDVM